MYITWKKMEARVPMPPIKTGVQSKCRGENVQMRSRHNCRTYLPMNVLNIVSGMMMVIPQSWIVKGGRIEAGCLRTKFSANKHTN